eukprot:scaffold8281_cov111-Skeletonema_dohrnii-CCMP3373.AAC.8
MSAQRPSWHGAVGWGAKATYVGISSKKSASHHISDSRPSRFAGNDGSVWLPIDSDRACLGGCVARAAAAAFLAPLNYSSKISTMSRSAFAQRALLSIHHSARRRRPHHSSIQSA